MGNSGHESVNPPSGHQESNLNGTGHIIVRLAKRQTHDTQDLRELVSRESFNQLASFLETNAHLDAERLIRHTPPERLREHERAAAGGPFAPVASLTAYWRIDVRDEDNAELHREALQGMPEVDLAYHETSVTDASAGVAGANLNPYEQYQGYLGAAPIGIGASRAWEACQCAGEGVNVIDLESGWIFGHEDLPKPQLLYGDDGVLDGHTKGDHGAAAMSVVGAINNKLGVIGVAPHISSLNAVSHYDVCKKTELHVADAIIAALTHLCRGDILLLEVQRYQDGVAWPVEVDSADLNAILLAVSKGIIVIEPAANGKNNLASWVDPTGQHSLDVKNRKAVDSGAIMTGSASSNVLTVPPGVEGHKRYYTSNWGNRIDVYAWGEFVLSAGYGDVDGAYGSDQSYGAVFGETSAASAIIAGAAALVQSWHKGTTGSSLTSAEMRTKLSNPETGTPQVLVSGEPIGVMPNVHAIVSASP